MLHDKILGAVSHLPHVAAFALMKALADVRDHGSAGTRFGRPFGRRFAGYDADRGEFSGNVARYFLLESGQSSCC